MNVRLDPLWRQAVVDLLNECPEPGHLITKAWLNSHFELEEGYTADQFKRYHYAFLEAMEGFRNELLVDHNIALKVISGVGYQVIAPKEQTRHALAQGYRRIRRDVGAMAKMLRHVDVGQLTDEQRQENADAQAKATMLSTILRRSRRLHVSAGSSKLN